MGDSYYQVALCHIISAIKNMSTDILLFCIDLEWQALEL